MTLFGLLLYPQKAGRKEGRKTNEHLATQKALKDSKVSVSSTIIP